MAKRIMQGVWSVGVLAAASTPGAAQAQEENNACYRCECDDLGCVCSLIACPDQDP